jgi:hypothetical protein
MTAGQCKRDRTGLFKGAGIEQAGKPVLLRHRPVSPQQAMVMRNQCAHYDEESEPNQRIPERYQHVLVRVTGREVDC